jgi:hypothetical protein
MEDSNDISFVSLNEFLGRDSTELILAMAHPAHLHQQNVHYLQVQACHHHKDNHLLPDQL